MFNQIISEIDDIATILENKGMKRSAAKLDIISNSLEDISKRVASGKLKVKQEPNGKNGNGSRKAEMDEGLSMPKDKGAEPPPGWESSDEAGHSDSFDAYKAYGGKVHRVPVGNDSMSRLLEAPSPQDFNLDLADEGKVFVQSSKGRRKAESEESYFKEVGGDPADSTDWTTTSGLPETGNEIKSPPVDKSQEGDTLPFLSTVPAGDLHMPSSSRKKAQMARDRLRKAADVIVKNPDDLLHSEAGENVERDQSLGGKGENRLGNEAQPSLGETQDLDLSDKDGDVEGEWNLALPGRGEYSSPTSSKRSAGTRRGKINFFSRR